MKYNFDIEHNRMGTYCTQWDYVQDRFGKEGVIPFTISDSDFKVLPEIQMALNKVVNHGIFGYSRWNHEDFKGAIHNWFNNEYQTDIPLDEIVYGPTVMYMVKTMIALITQASARSTKVLSFEPMYDGFIKLAEGIQKKIIGIPLRLEEGVYKINFDLLEKIFADNKKSILLLCNPLNPIGKAFTKQELKQLILLSKKNDIFIVSDDIHMDFVFQPNSHVPIYNIAYDFAYSNNIAIISSASKTFNTASLQCAYMIIPNKKLRESYLYNLREVDCLSSVSIMGLHATMAAYKYGKEWAQEQREYIYDNHLYIKKYIKDNSLRIYYSQPQATYFAWLDMHDFFKLTSSEIQNALLEENVAIMGGGYYFINGDGNYLRLNIAAPRKKIQIAMEALKNVQMRYEHSNE